ncbi:PI-PLC X domain-containing protein [Echinococcus granulosus]|uniref:PI-PLC X domain-containing protein n=1 Tax=Echinococcus granulosus TaxID=6210 RepID=W6UUL8_ECHGR|nr:PI-PLC X domain-containing protein [Echinococcus granulosus]EUB64366.1 PI-PLC X domain-containing protein [Echinococcus granulosus]
MDTWMSNLPETLTNVPLSMLAIPGSHDSCSYCLNCECELSQDNEAFPALMLLGKFGKLLSARWGRTQDVSLSEQLAAGIRYFDFRVIHREVDGLFYFVHGQFANEVSAELSIIRSFLQEHHKEVVLLDFNHLYCFFKPDSTSLLERTIVKMFNPSITPLRIKKKCCNFSGKYDDPNKVFVAYRILSAICKTIILCSYFSAGVDKFHVTQGVLTPDSDYILNHMDSDLAVLAASAGERVIEWLTEEVGQRNVVMIDFAVKMFPHFAKAVISMNTSRQL